MKKKGYAFRKAVELIAYERGIRPDKPPEPKSKALKGAVISWKNKLEKRYRPRQDESKIVFQKTMKKEDVGDIRPFLRVEGQYHAKRIGNDIRDVIYGFEAVDKKTGSPRLLEITDTEVDIMHEIANQLQDNNNPTEWNKAFRQMGLDEVEVWTERYIEE